MVLLIFLSVPDSHLSASPYVFCTQCWRLSIVKVCMWGRSAQSFSLSHDHTHIHTHTHTTITYTDTHTHTYTHAQNTKWKNVRSCYFWPPCDTSGELWASTRQPPEVGPGNRRSTEYAFQLWCGHPAVPTVP